MISSPSQEAVDAAITSRRSIRAFLDKPVERDEVARIKAEAARAIGLAPAANPRPDPPLGAAMPPRPMTCTAGATPEG